MPGSQARAAQSRPRALPPPPDDPAEEPDEPVIPDVIILSTAKTRTRGRRVVVFSIDGKDYSVPENPPAGILLEFMAAVREHGAGSGAAEAVMLDRMLGTDGYQALQSHPDLTITDLANVIAKVTAIFNAAMESPKD